MRREKAGMELGNGGIRERLTGVSFLSNNYAELFAAKGSFEEFEPGKANDAVLEKKFCVKLDDCWIHFDPRVFIRSSSSLTHFSTTETFSAIVRSPSFIALSTFSRPSLQPLSSCSMFSCRVSSCARF